MKKKSEYKAAKQHKGITFQEFRAGIRRATEHKLAMKALRRKAITLDDIDIPVEEE